MIVPSIDLMSGNAVQLIGGRELEIDAGDPRPIATKFGRVGEIAVIDLDAAIGGSAAMGEGGPVWGADARPAPFGEPPHFNRNVILDLVKLADCRVGGGIRSVEKAIEWLDAGASKVILGTAATPEILRELPRERVIAALDADKGEVVVEGWRKGTGRGILERIGELRDYVGGFLVTFVEKEGRLGGTNLDQVAAIVEAAGSARVTIAGGVTTAEDIAALDRMGADAQIGMALYSGRLGLAEGFAAPLISDRPDGLWPTVVCDEHGQALGLAYSNAESLSVALERGVGAYWSRKRGLWVKGETSGATQELISVGADCDRDCLRFVVRQKGPFCHLGTRTCWGQGLGIGDLERLIADRAESAPPGSYTARLFKDPNLLDKKIREEADELIAEGADTVAEFADLLYFSLIKLHQSGHSIEDVERLLNLRSRKVTRRPGNAKEGY